MGYEVHVVRREGEAVGEAEWRAAAMAEGEAGLEAAGVCFVGGEVAAKNPDAGLVARMVKVARRLGAEVEGDDREIYGEDGETVEGAAVERGVETVEVERGALARFVDWVLGRKVRRGMIAEAPAFRVGGRVKDPWGGLGTVVCVDLAGNGGLGELRVRRDDGKEERVAVVASGWDVVEEGKRET